MGHKGATVKRGGRKAAGVAAVVVVMVEIRLIGLPLSVSSPSPPRSLNVSPQLPPSPSSLFEQFTLTELEEVAHQLRCHTVLLPAAMAPHACHARPMN